MLGLGLSLTTLSTSLFNEQDAVIALYVPEWNYVDESGSNIYVDESLQDNYIPEFNFVDESGSNIYTTEG